MSAPRIDASGCGFWPTAVADGDRQTNYAQGGTSLGFAIRNPEAWPTPRVSMGHGPSEAEIAAGDPKHRLETAVAARGGATRQTWGTPTSRDHKDTGTMENVPENALLGRQVLNRQWPTPQTVDGKKTARPLRKKQDRQTRNETPGSYRGDLADHVARGQSTPQTEPPTTSGSLSPLWVEFLMGWPPAWTDSGHSVTDKSLTSWRLLGVSWLKLLGYLGGDND